MKKVRTAQDKAQAEALLPEVMSVIDKTAKKGVIHKNAAARYKSQAARVVGSL
jgi:small subunit ribosomal protein S20